MGLLLVLTVIAFVARRCLKDRSVRSDEAYEEWSEDDQVGR